MFKIINKVFAVFIVQSLNNSKKCVFNSINLVVQMSKLKLLYRLLLVKHIFQQFIAFHGLAFQTKSSFVWQIGLRCLKRTVPDYIFNIDSFPYKIKLSDQWPAKQSDLLLLAGVKK